MKKKEIKIKRVQYLPLKKNILSDDFYGRLKIKRVALEARRCAGLRSIIFYAPSFLFLLLQMSEIMSGGFCIRLAAIVVTVLEGILPDLNK